VSPDRVYWRWRHGFGAGLTEAQVEALRGAPDVEAVEPDAPGRPAPYHRLGADARIAGSYLVLIRDGVDPGLRRLAVHDACWFGDNLLWHLRWPGRDADGVSLDPGIHTLSPPWTTEPRSTD
jgi:hypothetical protein